MTYSDVDHSGLVQFSDDLNQGQTIAEHPDSEIIDGKSTLATIIPVRGTPAEERLVHRHEVLNIPDVARDDSLGPVRDIILGFGIKSILIVPVILHDVVVASFSLDAIRQLRSFTPDEIKLCKSLADQVAVAIENARLLEEAREGREYLQSLYEASSTIILPHDPNEVLQRVANIACEATKAWRAVVILVDEKLNKLARVLAKTRSHRQSRADAGHPGRWHLATCD